MKPQTIEPFANNLAVLMDHLAPLTKWNAGDRASIIRASIRHSLSVGQVKAVRWVMVKRAAYFAHGFSDARKRFARNYRAQRMPVTAENRWE